MSTYTPTYGPFYGTFPTNPLDAMVELDLAGTWTDISTYAYQRDGEAPPISITRGRPDETSQATASQCTMQWNNRDGRFTARNPTSPYYGEFGLNTPARISVPDQTTYLRFADDQVSYCSTPSSAGLNPSGDTEWQLDLNLASWMPCVLTSKDDADTERSWSIRLNGDGTIALYWFTTGSAANLYSSTLPLPFRRISLRITLAMSTGTVTWYTSATPIDDSPSWTQLGAQATAGATSLFDSTTAVAIGANAAITALDATAGVTTTGPAGQFYGFRLYSGIAGTLKASPDFTTATSGAGTFTDGQGNVWTLAGTAEFSDRSFRGHFECSQLPVRWDPSGTDIWVPVTASGVLRRLQQGSAPILSAMRRGVTSYPTGPSAVSGGASAPQSTVAYWACEDGQGATSFASSIAANADGITPQPIGFSGTPGIQATTGSPEADSIFACSAQLPTIGSSRWTATVPPYNANCTAFTLLWLLAIPSGGLSAGTDLLDAVFTVPGFASFTLTVNYTTGSGGSITLTAPGGTTSAITGVNGVAYWVALANDGTGTATATLALLNVNSTGTLSQVSVATDSGGLAEFTVNPYQADCGDTEIGQFWASAQWASTGVAPAAPDIGADPLASLAAAYAGETAGARVARLCGENGLQARIYGPPDSSAAMQAQQIDTLANVLQSCEDADQGILYEPAECLGLGYRTLASLCTQAPAATLDYATAQIGISSQDTGLVPTNDDQTIRNDVILTRNNGTSAEAQITTGPLSIQPPPAGVGDYNTSRTVYCDSDSQLADIAAWMAWVGTANEDRYPSVPVNLARPETSDVFYDVQDVLLGDYVSITNPPAWTAPGPVKQLMWCTTEQLGGFFWQITWNTVPESPYEIAVAGTDGTDSARADTEGSSLAVAATSTAATLSVATAAGPLWTTDDGGAGGQQSIVPLYSYPPSSFWTDVTANAGPMGMIICNVDSGPGTGYESNFAAVFAAAAAAGITCLGYVPTGYGADSVASVEAQVDLWETYYGITSIMFDTVMATSTYLANYTTLVEYVHGRGGIAVLNPGDIPDEAYMSIADVIQVCEDSYANLATDAGAAPSWLFDYPATTIAITVNECSTEGDMVTAVGLAASAFNAHYCWVTADGIYAAEPSYFADEVTTLDYAPAVGGDFPFNITVAGEELTVNGITGGSSPQTFSVVRSVNGVVKAQAEDAALDLADLPVLGLAGVGA